MNKLMTGLAAAGIALTAAVATPVLADTYSGRYHAFNAGAAPMNEAYDAYAFAPKSGTYGYASAPGAWLGSHPVIQNGEYRGADPDPAIRLELMRDAPQSES